MIPLNRITFDPKIMGGKPCIRGMRVTAGMIVGLVATGHNKEDILKLYPYLEVEDIDDALTYSAIHQFEKHLEEGAIVTVDEKKSRVRILPL